MGKSAPARWGIGKLKLPKSFSLFTMVWRRSAARTNTSGDNGSPCLTPHLQWNTFPGTPFSRTDDVPVWRMDFIQEVHLLPKPLCFIIFRIASCSILSSAFSKSNFRITISLLDDLQIWRYSNAQARQSWIVVDLMNPYWFLWISLMITCCNLWANSLVSSFMVELRRDIGLKSPTRVGYSFFGTRVM